MNKNFFSFIAVSFLFIMFSYAAYGQGKLTKVVIDAGHGGHDPGALGAKSHEKDIALSVALLLGKKIEETYPDVKVIYTRKTDVFVELFQRASIANRNHADLFISIHCNSSPQKNANGNETFIMGLGRTAANLSIAQRENASVLLEKDYEKHYDGFDPNSPEGYIIFSLFQNAFMQQSSLFASLIQQNYDKNLSSLNRGVKQAGFAVIYRTTMPSVLTEIGFISNPEEETFMTSPKGQETIANSLVHAFGSYKKSVEKNTDGKEIPKKQDNLVANATDSPENRAKDTANSSMEKGKVSFRVQFLISAEKKSLKDAAFQDIPNVKMYIQNKTYKYTAGDEDSEDAAVKLQQEIRKKYKDAFIIAWHNGERIPLETARELMKK